MEELIPQHGGFRRLKSFQVAQLVYDLTVRFCDRYVSPKSRTRDQMIQAARSGVQNIAEGSQASGTSKKTELKLTNVARASLEELRLDYEDFLRQRGFTLWDQKHPLRTELIARRFNTADEVAAWVNEVYGRHGLHGHHGQSHTNLSSSSMSSIKPTRAAIAANAALVLLVVACTLLDRQLAAQAQQFQNEGGFTERLFRIRNQHRGTLR